MKKIGVIVFGAALVIGLLMSNIFSFGRIGDKFFNFSLNFGKMKGSGNTASEARDLNGFKAIDVGGVFEVEITAQRDFSVEVEADDNLLPFISTFVRGGSLHIETEKRISTSNPIRVRVSAPDIDNLDVSGAAKVTINDLKNASLAVDSSGASKITIAGETGTVSIDVSGATNVNAENLRAVKANVEASGASHVGVNVSGELRADASGASKITYSGSPANVEKKSSGASRISPR